MRFRHLRWLLPLTLGCTVVSNEAAPDSTGLTTSTGLEGVVRRGPIQPVCWPDATCDAPFSARFDVRSGDRRVAQFYSDSTGHFEVSLTPGEYLVMPDSSAPLLGVLGQSHVVVVGADGPTHVELLFDTGIR